MVEVSPERAGAALERARAFVAAAKAQVDKMIAPNDRTS
jgi:hypothetical protein